jgi:DNA-binding NarL/FixJ family response regulator
MQILIVDDHPLFREGLANVLAPLAGDDRILFADDAMEGVAILQRESGVALVLLDGNLPKMNGVRAIPLMRQLRSALPIVMISANETPDDVRAALLAGANGYLSKSAKSAEILDAIRTAVSGQRYVPAFARDVVQRVHGAAHDATESSTNRLSRDAQYIDPFGLTVKQAEVLAAICEGLSNKAIAEQMGITENTVKVHVGAIFAALNVKSRTQAMLAARSRGFAKSENASAA